jgi:hypothetical protein
MEQCIRRSSIPKRHEKVEQVAALDRGDHVLEADAPIRPELMVFLMVSPQVQHDPRLALCA